MIRFKAILHTLGLLMVINALFMAFCLPVSWVNGGEDFNALLVSVGICGNLGLLLWYRTRKVKKELGKRDGYLTVTLGWLVLGLTGSIPFILSGMIESIPSAIFETISGYTTTGATILNDIEAAPQGLLLWRSMTQWIGGMGIIVLTVAILPFFGVGGVELFMAEAPGLNSGKLHPKIADTAKRLWLIYMFLTAVETVCLKLAGMTWLEAVNHSFTTMSTGGFSTKNTSIAAFNSPTIEYIISAFMLVGGINFSIIYFLFKFNFKKVFKNEEFKVYLGLIVAITAILTVVLLYHSENGFEQCFRDSLFQVISIITTTGFSTVYYTSWVPFALMLIILLMFTGGSAGSTAGGMKIVRHLVILKNAYAEFKRLLHPRGVIPVRISHQPIQEKIVYNVLAFFFIYVITFVLGTVVISAFGHNILTSAGAAIACLGNIGPGIGGVGPNYNFAFFDDGAKLFLSFLMLLGRLEFFTVLILLTPSFWKKV